MQKLTKSTNTSFLKPLRRFASQPESYNYSTPTEQDSFLFRDAKLVSLFNTDDGFGMVYQSPINPFTNHPRLVSKRYTLNGKLTAEFQLPSGLPGYDLFFPVSFSDGSSLPSISIAPRYHKAVPLANDNFIVIGEAYEVDVADVVAQCFDKSGNAVSDRFIVNTLTNDWQQHPDVASLTTGNAVVTWESRLVDGSDYAIMAQILSPNCERLGPEFRVNAITEGLQLGSKPLGLQDGGFLITFTSELRNYYLQRFDAAGNNIPLEFNTQVSGDQSLIHSQYLRSSAPEPTAFFQTELRDVFVSDYEQQAMYQSIKLPPIVNAHLVTKIDARILEISPSNLAELVQPEKMISVAVRDNSSLIVSPMEYSYSATVQILIHSLNDGLASYNTIVKYSSMHINTITEDSIKEFTVGATHLLYTSDYLSFYDFSNEPKTVKLSLDPKKALELGFMLRQHTNLSSVEPSRAITPIYEVSATKFGDIMIKAVFTDEYEGIASTAIKLAFYRKGSDSIGATALLRGSSTPQTVSSMWTDMPEVIGFYAAILTVICYLTAVYCIQSGPRPKRRLSDPDIQPAQQQSTPTDGARLWSATRSRSSGSELISDRERKRISERRPSF